MIVPFDDGNVDGSLLSHQLRQFNPDETIELYVEADIGPVRIHGTVSDTHTFPGTPGGEIADWETQFSLNLDDHSYEGIGDIRCWGIATQLKDGEWNQPRAIPWCQEENELVELFSQPVIYIKT